MKTVPGKLLYVLSINVRIYIYSYQSNLDKCRPEQGENNIHRTHRIQFFVNAHTHKKGKHEADISTGTQGHMDKDRETENISNAAI